MQHDTAVRPRSARYADPVLQVERVKVYGYQARCRCGWRGSTRHTWHDADADARYHRAHPPAR